MKEIKQPNDILVATLMSPEASSLDLLKNDINIDNTALLSPDEYKATPFIKKHFTDDKGVFNEEAFNKVYNMAAQKYWELDDAKLKNNLEEYLEYSNTSRFRPTGAQKRDLAYKPFQDKNNPLQQATSLTYFNEKSAPVFTPEEAAQQGGIWDPETKQWLEGTAENRSFLSKAFGQTLVYAQYEKDGYQANPITGEMGEHKKGEFITDANGQYFTELLGNRDLLDKKVVSLEDILTEEGSAFNNIDFFDSDGYDKSIGGVAMKTLIKILPYVIPGLNKWYGALHASMNMAAVMPTLYKSIEGLFTGENPSKLSESATKMENWFRKFDPSMSRKGQSSFFSIESLGNMVADTFGQLHQQRAAASLSKFFKKLPDIKEVGWEAWEAAAKAQNKVSTALSLGYMGLTQAADVYNEALNSGYDKRTAGIASLASAGAMYGIMNINAMGGLGTWFLDKTVGYNSEVVRKPIAKVAKSSFKELEKAVQEVVANPTSKMPIANWLSKFKVKVANIVDDTFRLGAEGITKAMITEGIEEVTEEAVQDAVKGIIDTLSWAGFTQKQGSFGGWKNVFSQEGAARYLQTLVGGAIGGAVFEAQDRYVTPWITRTFVDSNYKDPRDFEDKKDILDVVLSGRTEELIDELNRCRKLFSDKRAATGLMDGSGQFHDLKADGQKTQADMIVDAAIEEVRDVQSFVDSYLRGENFDWGRLSDEDAAKIRNHFRDQIHADAAVGYVRNKFLNELNKLKNIHTSLVGSQETKQSDKQDKKKSDKTNPEKETAKADQAVQEQTDEEKQKKADNLKNTQDAFQEQLTKVRGFFTGAEYVATFQELTKLHDITQFGYKGHYFSSLSKQNFYRLYIQNDTFTTPYDQLDDKSENPYKMTKEKVDRLWDLYKKETWKEDDFQEILPMLTKIDNNAHQLIDKDLLAFANHERKKSLIRAIKSGDIDYQVFKEWLDNANENDLFDAEQLAEFAGLTDEEKATALENAKSIKDAEFKQGYGHTRPSTIAGLIRRHPKAWTMQERRLIDYATPLIKKGLIELSGWTDEQIEIIKQLINSQAATKRINFLTPEVLEDLVMSVNLELSNTSNMFVQKLKTLQQPASNGVVSLTGIIDSNTNIDMSDIEFMKLDSMLDYLKDDPYIEEEEFNDLMELYDAQIQLYVDRILDLMTQFHIMLGEPRQQILNAVLVNENVDVLNGILAQAIQMLDPNEETYITDNTKRNKLISSLQSLAPLDLSNLSDDTYAPIKERLQSFIDARTNQSRKYQDKIVKNPLLAALDKLLVIQTGETGQHTKSVLKWAVEKAMEIAEGRANADLVDFSEKELQYIKDAKGAIEYLYSLLNNTLKYDKKTEGFYGSNQLMVDYLQAWGKPQELIDRYALLDREDIEYIRMVLKEASSKLDDLQQVKGEMTKEKTAEYEKANEETEKKLMALYSKPLPIKILGVDTPILTQEDINAAPKGSNLEYILYCKQKICQNIQNLKTRDDILQEAAKESKTVEQFLIDQMFDHFLGGKSPEEIRNILRSSERTTDAIQSADGSNIDDLSTQWLLNNIVGYLSTDPKTVYKKIIDSFEKNEQVYPRIDQIEALERIFMWYSGTENYNYLNSKFADLYNHHFGTPIDPADSKSLTWNKSIILDNVAFILGSGGSGKTLLVKLLKESFGIDIIGLAKSKLKADELKGIVGDKTGSLYETFSNLEQQSKTYKEFESKFLSFIFKYASDPTIEKKIDGVDVEVIDKGSNKFEFTLKHSDFIISTIYDNGKDIANLNVSILVTPDSNKIDKNSVIFLDECTVLNNFEWAYLGKVIKDRNAKLLAAGDPLQQSDTTQYTKGTTNEDFIRSLSPFSATFLPELLGSWRADNNLTSKNSSEFRKRIEEMAAAKTVGSERDFQQNTIPSDVVSRLNEQLKLFNFEYSISAEIEGYKFFGTHIAQNDDDSKQTINRINESTDKKSVAVIINPGDNINTVKNELQDLGLNTEGVQFVSLEDIQGAEFDYTIAYKLKASPALLNDITKIYTEITRAKKGNLVIDGGDGLFKKRGLTHDIDRKSEVSKQDFVASGNQEIVNRMKDAINKMPDVTIATPTSAPIPEPSKSADDDEKSKVTIESKGTASEEEAKASEGGAPSPETESVDEESSDDDKKSAAKRNTAITDELTNYGYKDFVIGQGFYMHAGLLLSTTSGGACVNDYDKADRASIDAMVLGWSAKDLLQKSEFEQFLWLRAKYKQNKTFATLPTAIKNALDHTEKVASTNNASFQFKVFIGNLQTNALKHNDEIWIAQHTYQDNIDYPLDKFNDNPTWRAKKKKLTRHVIPARLPGMTNQEVLMFTFATQGYTGYEKKDGSIGYTSKIYSDAFVNGTIPTYTLTLQGRDTKILPLQPKSGTRSHKEKYIDDKFKGSEIRPVLAPKGQSSPVNSITGSRYMKLDPGLLSYNETVIQRVSNLPRTVIDELKYNRLTLQQLLDRGYKIIDEYPPAPTGSEDAAKLAFKNWYNKYRAGELTDDAIAEFYDQTWIVIQDLGTGVKHPVQLRKISSLRQSLSDIGHSSHLFHKKDKSEHRTLNMYMHRKLIGGFAHLVGKSAEVTEVIRTFWENPADYDIHGNKYRYIDQTKSGTSTNFKSLFDEIEKALVSKGFTTQASYFKAIAESYMHYLNHMSASRSGNQNPGAIHRDEAFKHKDMTISFSDPMVTKAADFLDTQLPKFFYETDINIDRAAIGTHAHEYVAEIVFESPNKVLDLGACDVIDWSKGAGGTISLGPAPTPTSTKAFNVVLDSKDSTKGRMDSEVAGKIAWTINEGDSFNTGDEIASITTNLGDIVSIIAPSSGQLVKKRTSDGKSVLINDPICDVQFTTGVLPGTGEPDPRWVAPSSATVLDLKWDDVIDDINEKIGQSITVDVLFDYLKNAEFRDSADYITSNKHLAPEDILTHLRTSNQTINVVCQILDYFQTKGTDVTKDLSNDLLNALIQDADQLKELLTDVYGLNC